MRWQEDVLWLGEATKKRRKQSSHVFFLIYHVVRSKLLAKWVDELLGCIQVKWEVESVCGAEFNLVERECLKVACKECVINIVAVSYSRHDFAISLCKYYSRNILMTFLACKFPIHRVATKLWQTLSYCKIMANVNNEKFVSQKVVYIRDLKLSININFRRSQAANVKSAVLTYCSRVDKRECV